MKSTPFFKSSLETNRDLLATCCVLSSTVLQLLASPCTYPAADNEAWMLTFTTPSSGLQILEPGPGEKNRDNSVNDHCRP